MGENKIKQFLGGIENRPTKKGLIEVAMCLLNTIAFEGRLACPNSSKPLAKRTSTCIFNVPHLDPSHPGQCLCLHENSL